MANVSLINIFKSFGNHEVIHGISCDILDGEFIVILGPSGCGKSTVLRMIAGLEEITQGQIAIDGKVVNQLEPANRDIAMVFQNYALYPHMTVFKNMAYGLKIRRMPKAEIEKRVKTAAEILELSDLLHRKPKQLSGGQRQRVAMGRCIVREPKVFLFDEPLSNLDAKLRVQMRLELRNLHERLGITSIYVTHDQVEAMTLGDRLIVMRDGYADQIGKPLDVYEKPNTAFVAGFIGSPSMNFFDAVLSSDGGQASFPGVQSLALADGGVAEYAGRTVTLGIRPEHLRIVESGKETMQLWVNHVEALGADTLVHGRLGEHSGLLTLRISGGRSFQKNAIIPLDVSEKNIHLFDKDKGFRLGS
jgi:sn-glycerol 3-phosphate transport system ATP-binding protein